MGDTDILFKDAPRVAPGIAARAALLSESNAPFDIADVTLQAPRADEVLVRIVAVGVCHTDVVCKGAFPLPLPVVLGHEGSGVVEAVGAAVRSVKVGDHVVLSFASCGECPNCGKFAPANCYNFMRENFSAQRADGSTPMSTDGRSINARFFGQSSFATHAITKERDTVVVPKEAPLERLGPLGCGIQTGAGAIMNSLAVGRGDAVAIFGGGAVGLSAVMAAKITGAAKIVLVEPQAGRRELALEFGATHVIDPKAVPDVAAEIGRVAGGMTHVLDTTGLPVVIAGALDTLLPKGVAGMLGFAAPDAMLQFNIMSVLARGITIKSIIEGDSDPRAFIPELVQHHLAGRLPFDRLLSIYPFDAINQAFEDVEHGKAIKPLLKVSDV